MWTRFTEKARRAVFLAQEEATQRETIFVSTEHLLLGILRDETFVASQVLLRLGVPLAALRDELLKRIGAGGDGRDKGDAQLTPDAKRVIDLSYEEAKLRGDNHIGTEHLLLGLIRHESALAGRILAMAGVTAEAARDSLALLLREVWQDGSQNPVRTDAEASLATDRGEILLHIRAAIEELKQTAPKLFTLDPAERDAAIAAAAVRHGTEGATATKPQPGDIGVARAKGRDHVEVAMDADTFCLLAAAYRARDAHGYRQLAQGDQKMFLVPNGTPLRCLVNAHTPSRGAEAVEAAVAQGGAYVRVLSGPYEGYAGWVFADAFARDRTDNTPFPPSVHG